MAFEPKNFVLCSKFNLFKAHANLWIYTTGDTLEDCLAEHYFQPRLNLKNQDSPEVGDVIQCIVENSKLAYLKIVAKTEKPYYITVARTFLENEAVIIAELADKASKSTDFVTPITDENLGITQTEQAELEEKIDLAANSGRMITPQGLWYAKMYAATVAPAAEDGTNYADFSQVDGQGNPIIVTYNRVSGAWVQDQTITPPAEYDGYVPITSKIWDIPEQDGQQGGRILWNHVSKEFTPYPTIITFDSVNLSGDSTVDMPNNPDDDNIANVGYVLDHCSARNVGDIFFTSRKDSILNGAVPCDGTTYQTTDYSGAQAPGALLEANKLPYVSLAQYDALLLANGSVGVFGWDGINTTAFRVPFLNDIFIETGTAAQVGDYLSPGAPNITGTADVLGASDKAHKGGNYSGALKAVGTASVYNNYDSTSVTAPHGIELDASESSSIYGNSNTIQPNTVRYRAMIQLSTGVRDDSYADLSEVAFTGSYNDLLNKPTIPDAQIQSDWTQTDNTKKDYIKNKPTIPTVNNSTITITQGGVTKGSFTTNQGSASTIALDAGGGSGSTDSLFVNATVIGSPNINGSIVDGLTTTSYLETPIEFNFSNATSFEVGGSFTTASDISKTQYLTYRTTQNSRGLIISVSSTKLKMVVANSGLGIQLTGDTVLTANTKYWFKVTYNGTSYVLSLSTDGINYTTDGSTSGTVAPPDTDMSYYIGWSYAASDNSVVPVSELQMENWYAKKNGSIIWRGAVGHKIIAFQQPTVSNNYTWYRKYDDGWVEQGGFNHSINLSSSGSSNMINLPVTMADTNYTAQATLCNQYGGRQVGIVTTTSTTTQVNVGGYASSSSSSAVNWQVSGMAS